MSGRGYGDGDCDEAWQYCLPLGWLRSAINGRRGQRLLRDLAAALDAMPDKRLIANELEDQSCGVCALGAVLKFRGLPVPVIPAEDDAAWDWVDPTDEMYQSLADSLDVTRMLVSEVAAVNDDPDPPGESPEARWQRVRAWVARQIVAAEVCEK